MWVQHTITLPKVTHPIKHNKIPYTPIDTCILQHSHYYSYGDNEYTITVLYINMMSHLINSFLTATYDRVISQCPDKEDERVLEGKWGVSFYKEDERVLEGK
ncbi:hypothetical protein Hanom_Chr12g01152711 [Helianthus anomalus]